jgi:hypothetical protein
MSCLSVCLSVCPVSSHMKRLENRYSDHHDILYWVTHSLTHGAEPFLRSCQLCSHSRNSQNFMEPEGSLPHSQEPSTGPILSQINPIHTIPSCLRSILILSTHLGLGLLYWLILLICTDMFQPGLRSESNNGHFVWKLASVSKRISSCATRLSIYPSNNYLDKKFIELKAHFTFHKTFEGLGSRTGYLKFI